jgi:hypothetical protein
MHGIAVALLYEDREHLTTLQDRLQATRLGREVFSLYSRGVLAVSSL